MTELPIQALAQVAIGSLLNSLPEGLLIALFAWGTLHLLPKQNARTRFAVWFLALLVVAGLPVVGQLTAGGISHGRILGTLSGGTALAHAFGSAGVPAAISLPAGWALCLFLIWLLAALAVMTRLAVGLWRLRQLRQSCVEVEAADLDPAVASSVAELTSAGSSASRLVTIATSERIRVPAALGFWKPMIVLPTWALEELSPSDLSHVLRHEFAHLQRWDDWTNLVQKIVRALFFFHPAVWWIDQRLSVEREMACDDVVVAQTENPTGYASCLVSLLERSLTGRGWTMAQALVHRAREASQRLTQILDRNRPTATRVSKPALGMVGAFTLLCLIVLPHTPRLVGFEQSRPAIAANHEHSVALTQPVTPGPSFVHYANGRASTGAKAVAASLRTPALSGPRLNSKSSRTQAAILASRSDSAASLVAGQCEAASKSNVVAPPETFVEVNVAFADRNSSLAPAILVFFETTEFLEFDSGSHSPLGSHYTVWRIEVWRLTVVNPVWKHAEQAPVAHST